MQFVRLDQGPKTLSGPWLPQEKGRSGPGVFPSLPLGTSQCCSFCSSFPHSPASQKGSFLDTLGATHLHPE